MACIRRKKNGLTEKKKPGRSPIYRDLIFKLFDLSEASLSFQMQGGNFDHEFSLDASEHFFS